MGDAILVTGAFGLVGTSTGKHLAAQGRHVVATDVANPATLTTDGCARPLG